MCTGFEYALIAGMAASTGNQLHAANTRPKPKQQQVAKDPVVRNKRNPAARTGTAGADSSFGLLNVGQPTLLGS